LNRRHQTVIALDRRFSAATKAFDPDARLGDVNDPQRVVAAVSAHASPAFVLYRTPFLWSWRCAFLYSGSESFTDTVDAPLID
jgi:hypothetical protein